MNYIIHFHNELWKKEWVEQEKQEEKVIFVLPIEQAERGQPNIKLSEPQFLVYM